MKPMIVLVLALCPLCAPLLARDLKVPQEYETIQEALTDAQEGDVITVSPGMYAENLRFSGKGVTLTSTAPNDPSVVAATILTAKMRMHMRTRVKMAEGSVVTFDQGETNAAVITGFTITGGQGTIDTFRYDDSRYYWGGGILCLGASPTIRGNVLKNNSFPEQTGRAYGYGGAIACIDSDALIIGNMIENNRAHEGGGIYATGGAVSIIQNTLRDNSAEVSGGGVVSFQATVMGNLLYHNTASAGGGVHAGYGSDVVNNTLVVNSADQGANLFAFSQDLSSMSTSVINNIICNGVGDAGVYWMDDGGTSRIAYNNVWGNEGVNYEGIADQTGVNGNISKDPLFADPETHDYHLLVDSPCVSSGDPIFVPPPDATDIDGQPRLLGGRVDIGFDEYDGYVRPIADAGTDQYLPYAGQPCTLDGCGSYVYDADSLRQFAWSQTAGQAVQLSDPAAMQPTFTPPVEGRYEFELVVSDGRHWGRPDTVAVTVGFISTDAVASEWPLQVGGNGHCYQAVYVPQTIYWGDAKRCADLAGGYLATITSQRENEFVFDLTCERSNCWYVWSCRGHSCGPWLGGYQEEGAPEPDGGWMWVTGEPFEYTNWWPGEPTGFNNGIQEDLLHLFSLSSGPSPFWNDRDENFAIPVSYVIEYERVTCEAEDTGPLPQTVHPGYSGAGYVVVNTSEEASMTWPVVIGRPGPRRLHLRYMNPSAETAYLSILVNDHTPVENLRCDESHVWRSIVVDTHLDCGENTVTAVCHGSDVCIDRLTLLEQNTNLALGANIRFSAQNANHPAANAVDGDPSTYWSVGPLPQWLELDLGDLYRIDRTQLIFHTEDSPQSYQFKIDGAEDRDGVYQTIVDRTDLAEPATELDPVVDTFEPVDVRYIRLTITCMRRTEVIQPRLCEFRVGASVSPATPITAYGCRQQPAPWQ